MATMKRFKVCGCRAHVRPGNNIDVCRVIWAWNIYHAMKIYWSELRGVKKTRLISVKRIK